MFGSLKSNPKFSYIIDEIDYLYCYNAANGGARGVMVIVVGNGHGDTSSNPEQD